MAIPTAESGKATMDVSQTSEPRMGYSWYVVIILMTCYTLSFIDRQILGLLEGPIKQELGIGDTKFGLLAGLAFAVLYTLLGLPMGRIADRYSRRHLIAARGVLSDLGLFPKGAAGDGDQRLFSGNLPGRGTGEYCGRNRGSGSKQYA